MPAVAAVFVAEVLTSAVVFAAIAEVGLVLTVVGAVTGNSTLTKIGGVLGIVGGVGGLVSGLGSTAASTAGNLAGDVAGSAASEVNSLGYIGSDIAQNTAIDTVGSAAADTAGAASAAIDGPINYSGSGFADPSGGLADSGTTQLGAIGDTPSLAQQTFPDVGAPTPVGAPAELAAPSAPNGPVGYQSPTNPLAPPQQSGGFLNGILGDKGSRDLLVEGAKLVGGGLQGAEKTRLEEERLKQQMGTIAYNQMVREREQANANAQPRIAGRIGYAPNPNLFTQRTQPVGQFKGVLNAPKA